MVDLETHIVFKVITVYVNHMGFKVNLIVQAHPWDIIMLSYFPHLQEAVSCSYPEPYQSRPFPPAPLLKDSL